MSACTRPARLSPRILIATSVALARFARSLMPGYLRSNAAVIGRTNWLMIWVEYQFTWPSLRAASMRAASAAWAGPAATPASTSAPVKFVRTVAMCLPPAKSRVRSDHQSNAFTLARSSDWARPFPAHGRPYRVRQAQSGNGRRAEAPDCGRAGRSLLRQSHARDRNPGYAVPGL